MSDHLRLATSHVHSSESQSVDSQRRDQLYFDRVHAFAPILQESRYLPWPREQDKSKPRMCLQYAMWTMAASLSTQFQLERRSLYTEARVLRRQYGYLSLLSTLSWTQSSALRSSITEEETSVYYFLTVLLAQRMLQTGLRWI